MGLINEYLKKIKEAIYGEEVRGSIHDAIEQCYKDATGHPESVAATVKEIGEVSKRIDNLIATGTAQSQEVGKTIATTSQGSKTKINFSDSNVIYTSAFDTVKISDSLFARIDEDDGSPLQILKEGLYYLNASVEIKSEESTIPATAYMILLEMTDEQYNKIGSPIRRVIDFPSNPTFSIERQQISYLFKAEKKTNLRFIVSSIADTSDKLAFSIDDIMLTALDWKGKQSADLSELHDLRIGADGVVHNTAGEAVRKQIGKLTEDLDNRSELVELNAKGQENKVWYQKGVKKTDAGWKCVEYDVTNVSKIYVTGIGKLYRDFVTGFKNGVYVKSLYQENQQETYTDYECDVSNCDTIFALQFVNTDPLSVKIKSIKTDIYTISELTKEITYRSVMNGYYSKTKLVDSVGDKIYIYDIRDYQKINVIGTIRQYRNLYTLFDSSMNPVDYGIQLVADGKADFELDTTNYAYIGIDSNTGSTNWTVLGKLNFRNFAKNENTKIYKSWIPMKWVRTEQYTYQRNKQYAPANMVSNVFDVSELNTVRIKAKSSAYVNYYTLLKDGEVIDYNFNDSSNNLVEIDNIVDTSRGDTLLVTVDHGHEARQGIAYVEKEIYVNNLYGKTIGWWGTSIPAFGAEGYNHPESYPNIIGGLLGANVVNHAVGESCVHCKDYTLISDSNPYGFVEDFRNVSRCLTNTIEEMQWIIDNFNSGVFTKNVPNSLSDDDKSLILGCSYENRLIPYLDSTDIFVFDHGHNDKADAGNHSYDTTKDIYGEKNLYSYVGAMNWIMNLIKTNNPRAVVIQISEYDYNTNKYGVLKQQKFVDIWGIPFMELYKLTGWTSPITIKTTGYWGTDGYWVSSGGSGQNLTIRQMFLKDDLHPYTDRSNKTAWYLAELIANWMKNTI